MSGVLSQLGWRWANLSARDVSHLVPPTILTGSRTACGMPLQGRMVMELGLGFGRRCSRCEARDTERAQ